MANLPVISGEQAIVAFQKDGWEFKRQGKGHVILVKTKEMNNLSIPLHNELDRGTLRSLIRKSGMTVDEFIKLLD